MKALGQEIKYGKKSKTTREATKYSILNNAYSLPPWPEERLIFVAMIKLVSHIVIYYYINAISNIRLA